MRHRSPVEPVLRLTREVISQSTALGVREILPQRPARRPSANGYPASLRLPPADGPFHFTHRMSLLCADIARRIPTFHHIDMQRVLVTFVHCRNPRLWGLQAKLVPLRFRGGALTQRRRGHEYTVQRLYVGEIELSYVLSFYLPRFLNQSFDEKMITVFHELYHIGPGFEGDIRRFAGGTGSVHNGSQKEYDGQMAALAREYLSMRPPRELHDFLRLSFEELRARYQQIVGVNIPAPKLIPVSRCKA